MRHFSRAMLALLAATASVPALADTPHDYKPFTLVYGGVENGASALGTIYIDTANGTPFNDYFKSTADGFIKSVSLTVKGASSGNGTFTLNDFPSYIFGTSDGTQLDFSKQLIGQPLLGGGTFGDNSGNSDFNFQTNGPKGPQLLAVLSRASVAGASPPEGVAPFLLEADGGSGDTLRLTSFAPAVAAAPEPATWAMMFMGLGIAGYALHRRRKGVVTTQVRFA